MLILFGPTRSGQHYEKGDVEVLTFVGQHIAQALARAQAIDETRQRNAELALINDVQEGLARNLDMQSMYDLVGDRLRGASMPRSWTSGSSTSPEG